jgi:hypothetical protein
MQEIPLAGLPKLFGVGVQHGLLESVDPEAAERRTLGLAAELLAEFPPARLLQKQGRLLQKKS